MAAVNNVINFADGWDIIYAGIVKLRNNLEGVSNDEFSISEYVKIHSTVYCMCNYGPDVHNNSHQIYEKYREFLEEYMSGKVLPALSEEYDEFMLRAVSKWWKLYKDMIRYVSNMLSVVDETLVKKRKLASLFNVGFICFRELVYYRVRDDVKNAVMKVINRERNGERIDGALLRNIVDLFVEIGIGSMDFYNKDFEAYILEDTATYYSLKAALWISEDSCPQYLVKVEESLKQEKDRVAHYLHSSTEHKLLEKVQNELLSPFYETQLLEMEDSGCHALLKAGRKNDLSRMYKLFCAMPKGLEPIANIFSQHITSQGTAVIKCLEDAINSAKDTDQAGIVQEHSDSIFVHQVMELHDTYMDFVKNAFEDNNLFGKALIQAFAVICNKEVAGISVAELLSTFCNTLLKRNDDDHIDSELEKVVKLVNYVDDKDVFSEFCREKLSSRLLFNNKKVNENHERSLLSKLKAQCGSQLTSKMEAMINDFALNREMQATFHEKQNHDLTIDFSPAVLNTATWPTYQRSQLNLPSELLTCVEVFKDFYCTLHKNRKLTWIHSVGTCDLISHFDHKRIHMTVTTYQAATLLLFNDSQKLTYEDIKFRLNLTDEDVERLLHSLTCRNYRILLKQPPNKSIDPHDTFEFNSAFTHKMARIKIPHPSLMNEKKRVTGTVEKDRIPAIEAAIVRIMKSKKALHHQRLLSECIQQLQATFKPNIKALEKGIKDLISREFLQRDEQDPNIYTYVA